MDVEQSVECSEKNITDDGQSQTTKTQEEDSMCQLLNRRFQNREELLNSVRRFFSIQGYALSIKNSRKDKYVTMGCDRGGCYRDRLNIPMESRKRKTTTRLISCQFEVQGRRQVDGYWILEVRNNSHNHEPSSDMSGHPFSRRLSNEEVSRVDEMTKSGIPPRQIISSLRQRNPNFKAVSRTIYNTKTKINRENLGDRTMIQALFEELGQGEFIYDFLRDKNGVLTHLFFAHPTSIVLSRNYSNVFVMDCTYKTNKYKMPLLDIVGVTSFNTSFYSFFAFLKNEGEEDYIWALQMFSNVLGCDCQPSVIVSDRELALINAIKIIFPTSNHLLCVWHIEKNVLSNCKPHFDVEDDWNAFLLAWNKVIYSKSEEDYEEALKYIELTYSEKKYVINYIQKTWLPFKERFVSAWTEKYLHFGNRVSSRAEGAHSKLKKYLQVSTGNLRQVKDKICLAIENEFQEIKTQLNSEKLRIPHYCDSPFFGELIHHVSMHAMKELRKQYDMVRFSRMEPFCTGHFMATMGLPCAHQMRAWKDGTLPLSAINSQWRIDTRSLTCTGDGKTNEEDGFTGLFNELRDKYQQWPLNQKQNACETISQLVNTSQSLLLEPKVQFPKGRPLGSKKKKDNSSTRRDPSKFEIVEKTRKCGICRGTGHDKRKCEHKSDVDHELNSPAMDTIDLNMTPSSMDSFFGN